ncbi:MAG: DUF6483 family protein [Lachnospiraceae bacterium]|nr:DUF6483 family protein [Lachnospiraceae bacterium]
MGMIERDYIMRLIYEVIRTLLKLIFHIDIKKKNGYMFEEEQRSERCGELLKLIELGKLNEAENQLMDGLDIHDKRDLELALYVYAALNEKDSDFLEAHDFSRKEILDGIRTVCRIYGYGSIAESLTDEIDTEP